MAVICLAGGTVDGSAVHRTDAQTGATAVSQMSSHSLAGQGLSWPHCSERGVFCGLWWRWVAHCVLVGRRGLDPPPWVSAGVLDICVRLTANLLPGCLTADLWVHDSLAARQDSPLSSCPGWCSPPTHVLGLRDTGGALLWRASCHLPFHALAFTRKTLAGSQPPASRTASACSSH